MASHHQHSSAVDLPDELVEQAAAYSGAEDENRTADRIAEQEQELAKLIELRDALLRR